MDITTRTEETGNTIIKVTGELVAGNVDRLVETFNALEKGRDSRLFLDMAGISFMDSSGLKTCMQLHNNLRENDCELVCYNLAPKVKKVFEVTGADKKILLINSTSTQKEIFTQVAAGNDHITLIMVPIFEEVNHVRQALVEVCQGFYKEMGIDSAVEDFILAITEAMNNVVEHSKASHMEVELSAHPDRMVFIIRSDGIKFDPTEDVAMPDLDDDDLPEGGFGRAIVMELMDEVQYVLEGDKNVLTLVKKINGS